MYKLNDGNSRKMCKISSKFTIKTPEQRQNVKLVSLLLTLNRFHRLFWSNLPTDVKIFLSKKFQQGFYKFELNLLLVSSLS